MRIFNEKGRRINGRPTHGECGWDSNDPLSPDVRKFIYSDRGEGWMDEGDFNRKYGLSYMLPGG